MPLPGRLGAARRHRVAVLAAALAAAALATVGCAGPGADRSAAPGAPDRRASAPGVTADSVRIGSHQPMTGPAAAGYREIAPAAQAMFAYINDSGGVRGRRIDYTYKDDGEDPVVTVDVVRQLVSQDRVFAIFNGRGTARPAEVADYLNAAGVPDLFVTSGARRWDQPNAHPYTFGWQPDYLIEGKILGRYVKQHFATSRIGYLYQADELGRDGVAGLDSQLAGLHVVGRAPYETAQLSQPAGISAQLSALKASGAEVVVAFTLPAATAAALLTDVRIGYQPQLVVTNAGSDPTTLTGLLGTLSAGAVGADILDGVISDSFLPLPDDATDPWIALFKKVHATYASALPFDGNVEYGMAAAVTFAQALNAAGVNPTRQSLVRALEAGGLQGPGLTPFRFSRSSHAGYTGVRLVRLDAAGGASSLGGAVVTTDDPTSGIEPAPAGAQGRPGSDSFLRP